MCLFINNTSAVISVFNNTSAVISVFCSPINYKLLILVCIKVKWYVGAC